VYFPTGSYAAGARLVQAISQLPGVEEHKPDVDLRHDGVTVRLVTCRSEPARHPGRDLDRGGHALLARRARV
jgi:4a-hydroxytetrahydrobiopterin dehydratase